MIGIARGRSSHAPATAAVGPPTDASAPDVSTRGAGHGVSARAAKCVGGETQNTLLGFDTTDNEIEQVEADPSQLRNLIAAWMPLPAYQAKMERFFELAFQQAIPRRLGGG